VEISDRSLDVETELGRRPFRLGVAGAAAGVAAFLLAQLHAWPPHEDETLALFVGDQPLGDLFDTVLGERGGAPLHFLLVHAVAAISPTLTGLRLISVAFAVASIPVVAALVARLTDRRTALVATALVAASWATLFHGTYGRMYSLFLFASALSFLTLIRALGRGTVRSWALWALAAYATVATHQYGAFVIAVQAVYAASLRLRLQRDVAVLPGAVALALVAVAAIPLWRSNLVLASRFELGIGAGGQLGGSVPVLEYLRRALGDFVAGWTPLFALVAATATFGLASLARQRRASALLAALAVGVPAVGLAIARVGGSAGAPETRHLIFVLPFFALIVATGLLRLVRKAGSRASALLAFSTASLVAIEIAWGWHQTPAFYAGEPARREAAREAAGAWLAATSRPTDVLFGFDPLYLGAREQGAEIGATVVPRADPRLALDALLDAGKPLGRGVWVLDASDGARIVGNRSERLEIPDRSPGSGFETKVFEPFLIVRTLRPTVTPAGFLNSTLRVQQLGRELSVFSSSLGYETARRALESLTGT
jgi:hypothetical protein